MGADRFDTPPVEHYNAISDFQRVQAMGDHERRSIPHELAQGLMDEHFALGIRLAGEFIEDQDAWIAQDRASQGDALFLAARQLGPLLRRPAFRNLSATGE